MNKKFQCKLKKAIIYKKPNMNSDYLKEILYGEKFTKVRSFQKFYYGYCDFDKYFGYIKKEDLTPNLFKYNSLIKSGKAYFYLNNKSSSKTKQFLYLNSRVFVSDYGKKFSKINNLWIKNCDLKLCQKKKSSDFLNKIKLFNNTKYVWGGNTVDGIDCSGLVQELMKSISIRCPRDSKDQEIFFKKKIKLCEIKRGDLLFWKGHVAIALNKDYCIHAYGPAKKVTKMRINFIISKLLKNSLKLRSIRRPSF